MSGKNFLNINCSYLVRNATPSVQSFVEKTFTNLPATACKDAAGSTEFLERGC